MASLPKAALKHIRRNNNLEAHNLASLSRHIDSKTWLGSAPTMASYGVDVTLFIVVFQMLFMFISIDSKKKIIILLQFLLLTIFIYDNQIKRINMQF